MTVEISYGLISRTRNGDGGMVYDNAIDEVLDFIRSRFGVPEGNEEIEKEI